MRAQLFCRPLPLAQVDHIAQVGAHYGLRSGCVISRILSHLSMVDAEKTRHPWLVRDKLGRVYGSSGSIKSLRSLGFDMSHSDLLLGYSWVLGKDLIYRRSFSSLNLPVLRVHVILGTATGFKMAV